MPKINKINNKWLLKKTNNTQGWTETGNKLYHTARWRKLRVIVLNEEPICKQCDDSPSTLVDHKIPWRLGGSFWDRDNLQGLCIRCHNSKSGSESKKN